MILNNEELFFHVLIYKISRKCSELPSSVPLAYLNLLLRPGIWDMYISFSCSPNNATLKKRNMKFQQMLSFYLGHQLTRSGQVCSAPPLSTSQPRHAGAQGGERNTQGFFGPRSTPHVHSLLSLLIDQSNSHSQAQS